MLDYCLAYSLNLKMVATCSSVTSVDYTPLYPRRLFITTTAKTSKLTFIMTRSTSSLLETASNLYPPRYLIISQTLQQNSGLNTDDSIYLILYRWCMQWQMLGHKSARHSSRESICKFYIRGAWMVPQLSVKIDIRNVKVIIRRKTYCIQISFPSRHLRISILRYPTYTNTIFQIFLRR